MLGPGFAGRAGGVAAAAWPVPGAGIGGSNESRSSRNWRASSCFVFGLAMFPKPKAEKLCLSNYQTETKISFELEGVQR